MWKRRSPFLVLAAALGVFSLLAGCGASDAIDEIFGSEAGGPAAVNLGTAADFVILAKSGVSNTGTSNITGHIGLSPADKSFLTGFDFAMDSTNEFATSALVTGRLYAADMLGSTPAKMTTAVADMETAYTDAAGRTLPDETDLGAGEIGGLTLGPGLYKWGTSVSISTDVTLSGTGVWIFQIAGGLDIAAAKKVVLSDGADASNIFWQVAQVANLGTTSQFNGTILSQTAVTLHTGATINGRALAQTQVTLDGNIITGP